MTVSISSLQTELLKLLNGDNPLEETLPEESTDDKKEIDIENVITDEVQNADLKGGDNIEGMIANILTGGDKSTKIDNQTSEQDIIGNILLEDEKNVDEQKTPEQSINESLIEGGEDSTISGGKKNNSSNAETFDINDNNDEEDHTEEQANIQTNSEEEHNDSSSLSEYDSSEYSDISSDESDNDEKYVSVIKEFTTPAPALTGGLVGSSQPNTRIRIIPMFPYILNTTD